MAGKGLAVALAAVGAAGVAITVLTALLVGSQPPTPHPTATPTNPPTQPPLPPPQFCDTGDKTSAFQSAFTTLASANGYLTTPGQFSFYNISICQTFGNCFFQNGNEPYGFFTIPNGPYEPAHDPSSEPQRILPNVAWRLATDEAIVIFGCSPPPSRYFSIAHYVVNTFRNDAWVRVFGSIGDAVNQHRAETFDDAGVLTPEQPFLNNFVTVLASDTNVVDDVDALFTQLGVPAVSRLLIPASSFGINIPNTNIPVPPLKMGLQTFDDDFSLLLRIVQVEDSAAFNAYRTASPLRVVRLSRSVDAPARAPALHGPMSLISRVPSTPPLVDEVAALGAVRQFLVAKIGALYTAQYNIAQFNYSQNLLGAEVDSGAICYGLGVQCNGDVRDARYMAMSGAVLFPAGLPTINFVIGVNHKATGNADFSNVVAYNAVGQVGVASADDTTYGGSAAALLANTPYEAFAPYMFVHKFVRNCDNELFCSTIPATGFPAIPDNVPGLFVTRGYVQPSTKVGPPFTALLPPVHLRLTAKLP